MSVERWLPVVGLEGRYEVSDMGRLRSLLGWHGRRRHVMKFMTSSDGYQIARLRDGHGGVIHKRQHRLVLAAFVGPCPEGMETRHLNGNPADNRLSNLRYGTARENSEDKRRHGSYGTVVCPKGHLKVGANLKVRGRGHNECLTCIQLKDKHAAQHIRRWARANGWAVRDDGRLPAGMREAYNFAVNGEGDGLPKSLLSETCRRGHPWTVESTGQNSTGRYCLICRRANEARRRAMKAVA